MPVYTVHAPMSDGTVNPAADRIVFVRDGFHVWAAVAGPLWLAFHRLWLALLGYVAALLAITAMLWLLRVGADVRLVVMIVIAALMGYEAPSLQRWTLARGKWRQLDVVVAENREAAERRFFDRWAKRHQRYSDGASTDRGSPPPVRSLLPAAGSSSGSHSDVMGLFPQPGSLR